MLYFKQLFNYNPKCGFIPYRILLIGFVLFTAKVYGQPVITSFTPASGPVGTTVIITGNNFNTIPNLNIVYFGAVSANVISSTANSLSVKVPVQATYRPITVTTNGLTAYSSLPFDVTFPASNAVFSPNSFANKTDFGSLDNIGYQIGGSFAIGDMDGDGRPDIIEVNSARNTVAVYRNTSAGGTLSFADKVEFPTLQGTYGDPSAPINIKVGDVDGDGKFDIIVLVFRKYSGSDGGGRISFFKNTSTSGTIDFAPSIDFKTIGVDPVDLAIGDVDGDGKTDLVVTFDKGYPVVFRNTSNANTVSFSGGAYIQGGVGPGRKIGLTDMNGDRKPDVVLPAYPFSYAPTVIPVARNTSAPGTPSFDTAKLFYATGFGAYPFAVADLDGDNKPDMMVITGDSMLYYGSSVGFLPRSKDILLTVFRNTSSAGNISFEPKKELHYNQPLGDLTVADMDGDGKPDLVSMGRGDSISVLKNTSSPVNISFDSLSTHSINAKEYSADVADMDGDGKPDIIVTYAYGSFSILRNIPANIITAISPGSNNDDKAFTIYPNPAQNSLTVTYPADYQNADIQITTEDGRKLINFPSGNSANNTITRNISGLSKGLYILSFIKKGKSPGSRYFTKM